MNFKVTTRTDAERVIATLLTQFTSETAKERLSEDAEAFKQSTEEVARRTAFNLLNSFTIRRQDARGSFQSIYRRSRI